jgi:hypothetical protein
VAELPETLVAAQTENPTEPAGVVIMVDMEARQPGRYRLTDRAPTALELKHRVELVGTQPIGSAIVEIPHGALALRPIPIFGLVGLNPVLISLLPTPGGFDIWRFVGYIPELLRREVTPTTVISMTVSHTSHLVELAERLDRPAYVAPLDLHNASPRVDH